MKQYDVHVFFDGPRSSWGTKLHASEAIFSASVPWLWLARFFARSNVGNTGRCGYSITLAGETIEEQRAPKAFVAPA